ncbi:family 20 glycosylhydrolase [Bacteroidaceae bacterium HV4-6-C5C]|nr:family 20 glycosylhydrolase [Bacteroidaceae bacterium HV4-6-C5C]
MRKLIYFGYLLIWFLSACSTPKRESPISLTWTDKGYNTETKFYDNEFVLKNVSQKRIDNRWMIYYSQLPREIKQVHSKDVQIEVLNGNFYRIRPTKHYKSLEFGDSLLVRFSVSAKTPNISQTPEGFYWVSTHLTKESQPIPLSYRNSSPPDSILAALSTPQRIYNKNTQLKTDIAQSETDILPTVKNRIFGNGKITIPHQVSLEYSSELSNEANVLRELLEERYKIKAVEIATLKVRLKLIKEEITAKNKEKYKLDISPGQILIEAATSHGIFNGIQTLLAALKGESSRKVLANQIIIDYPDLSYRGLLLDVARNFTKIQNVKKLIDAMASYKLNVLHLHLTDDEGWRLEIPGLEELTEVGAYRGHTYDESTHLYPCYDGGYDRKADTPGNGFYNRNEFVDLLKYASRRHIRIIPEIDCPGHARAAIVSMRARFNKYKENNASKATEYLLNDLQDTSQYKSAQSYTDNVMNVALPSTYRFIEKVITEVKSMYKDAGIDLTAIHIGGDEVPTGAWMGSTCSKELMKEEGFKTTHDISQNFFIKLSESMEHKCLKFGGWQEVALHNTIKTDEKLLRSAEAIYCWNTVPEWGDDEIPYHLANKGYPVILCNVNNLYMDLAYCPNYYERGHSWAGYVDEAKSFSILPFSNYKSTRTDLSDNPINLDEAGNRKEQLISENKKNIIGIQAQLFTETLRSFDWVCYYLFPKVLGLVERGWNAHPSWEMMKGKKESEMFNEDLSRFYAIIYSKELPYLSQSEINFRLPSPGILVVNGFLYVNSSIKKACIRYTLDGSEPNSHSPIWDTPVPCKEKTIKARAFYLGKESVTSVLLAD